jgi:phosphoribosyl-ATP pyrophosphohydrolase
MSDAILKQLADVIDSRKGGDAAASYVARLFALGDDAILKKIGEEATEAMLAAKGGDTERIVSETADLWFHCMVMLSHYGLRPENVLDELSKRAGTSGIEEQALRKALARGL